MCPGVDAAAYGPYATSLAAGAYQGAPVQPMALRGQEISMANRSKWCVCFFLNQETDGFLGFLRPQNFETQRIFVGCSLIR